MKVKLLALVLLVLGLSWLLIGRKGHTNSERDHSALESAHSTQPPAPKSELPEAARIEQPDVEAPVPTKGTDIKPPENHPPKAGESDPAFPRSWFTDEGYTRRDIEDAKQLMLKEGLSGSQLTDPGTIRRYLLPRVTTMVQITNLMVQTPAKSGTPIPFAIEGDVPTPEFNFVRFETSRQEDLIIIRALGHSAAFTDENLGRPARMLPVKAAGALDPLPAGTYRISIPELGMSGVRTLVVE